MDIRNDIRYAVRVLGRSPGFTTAALLILGLGIGAATAIFTVANAVLLRPLSYPQPERLVSICETNPTVARYCVASPPNISDWAEASSAFEAIGFARNWSFLLRTEDRAAAVSGGYATPDWFRALRVVPLLGRTFQRADLHEGANRVAILSQALWTERFGGDSTLMGRSLTLDGESFTIVGVLPSSFVAPDLEAVHLWTPPPWDPRAEERRAWRGFQVVGRLATGVTLQQAQEELSGIQTDLARQHPETNDGWGVTLVPLHERITGASRPALVAFAGAVLLLLLIGCANLANLMLIRASRRKREMLVRAAIGAGRATLLRQLLIESLVLAGAGGALGLLLAAWGTRVLVRLAPAGIPRLEEAQIDPAGFAFTLALTLLTALSFGLIPALLATRVDLAHGLRGGPRAGRGPSGSRLRRVLVAAEMALTLMLLVGAGLLARSFGSLVQWEPGFDRSNVLVFSAFAPTERYTTRAALVPLWQRVEAQISSLPGVAAVGTASAGPIFGGFEPGGFTIVGDPAQETPPTLRWYDAGPGYFRALGLSIVRGRDLAESDALGGPTVAVINETFARRHFEGRDPIGQRLRMQDMDLELEIVGVVADVAPFYAGRPTESEMWWSNRQEPRWATYVLVRTDSEPTALTRAVLQRLEAIDPDLQIGTPVTIDQLIGRRLVGPRFSLVLAGVLALVALTLAATGTYGVLAYSAATRLREIGIRMALGAARSDVVRTILAEGATMAGAGLVIGAVGAFGLGHLLRNQLHGVAPHDPGTFAVTTLLLLLVALLASAFPALRASRLDAATVLREE